MIEMYRRETQNPSAGSARQKKVARWPYPGPGVEERVIAGEGENCAERGPTTDHYRTVAQVNYIYPRHWPQLRRQCNTMAGGNRGRPMIGHGRKASGATAQRGCQPRIGSRRVPTGE